MRPKLDDFLKAPHDDTDLRERVCLVSGHHKDAQIQ